MKRLVFSITAVAALYCAFVSSAEAAQIDIAFAGALNDDRTFKGAFWYDPDDLGSGEVMGSDVIYKDSLKNFLATLSDMNSVEKILENGFSNALIVRPNGLGFHFDGKDAEYLYIDLIFPQDDPAGALLMPPPLRSVTTDVAYYPGEGDTIQHGTLSSFAPTRPTAAIPEPASWTIMIAGLGLVGAGARRRRYSG